MLESLIVTLREGIEAALIVGIVVAALRKSGREKLVPGAYWGLLAAFLASLAGGIAMRQLHVGDDALEGALELIGAGFVATMVVWMMRAAQHLKGEIHDRLGRLADAGPAAWLGVFAFVFLMVGREGLETVLFLSAISMNSASLTSAAGTIVGLLLAVAFGVMFVRGTLKVNLGKFFSVTTAILWVVVVQLTISGLHELSEGRVLPASRQEMAIIGPIVHNDAVFFLAILALALTLVLWPDRKAAYACADEGPAERRKRVAAERRDRMWRGAAGATAFVTMLLIAVAFVETRQASAQEPPTVLSPVAGQVAIPLTTLADGKLHRYQVGAVRFDAIKDGDSVHTSLDACRICGPVGYTQEGPNLVCKNCGSAIDVPSVGEEGGCNPIPLKAKVQGDAVTVAAADLLADEKVFPQLSSAEVVDPVCGMRLHPEEGVQVTYQGKTYTVCKMKRCQDAFREHPEKYASR